MRFFEKFSSRRLVSENRNRSGHEHTPYRDAYERYKRGDSSTKPTEFLKPDFDRIPLDKLSEIEAVFDDLLPNTPSDQGYDMGKRSPVDADAHSRVDATIKMHKLMSKYPDSISFKWLKGACPRAGINAYYKLSDWLGEIENLLQIASEIMSDSEFKEFKTGIGLISNDVLGKILDKKSGNMDSIPYLSQARAWEPLQKPPQYYKHEKPSDQTQK